MADITKTIGSFINGATRFEIGTMDSGFFKFVPSYGTQVFYTPPSLSFLEAPVQVSSSDLTTSDLIVAAKVRVESDITYLYAVASTGKLYKIQANATGTPSPNNETITLLTTLTAGSATFKYGVSLTFGIFSGTTEGIYVGHDTGITKVHFDGSNETYIGQADSTHWIANVPRQVISFGQFLYYTNGTNIAEYSLASLTVTSYSKLNPGFPANYQARDIDVTSDGRYVVVSVSRTAQIDLTSSTINTAETGATDSFLSYWNGTDAAASSFSTIPAFSIDSYYTFNNKEYSFGSDALGACLNTPLTKDLTMLYGDSPCPNGVGSSGNMLGWVNTEFSTTTGVRTGAFWIYGKNEREIPEGLYRVARISAVSPQTDVIRMPFVSLITGTTWSASYKSPNFSYGNGKVYFSTVEYNGTTLAYRFYRFSLVPIGLDTTMTNATMETQTEIFPGGEKVVCPEVRLFIKPTAGTSFQCNLIGADGAVISGTSKTFTPSSTDDIMKYNPAHSPVAAMALQIVNKGTGTTSPTFRKIEVDLNYVNA